jgi:hypothetical protein
MLLQVCETGNNYTAFVFTIVNGGLRSLKPRKLGLGQDVTKSSSKDFSYYVKVSTTFQKLTIVLSFGK